MKMSYIAGAISAAIAVAIAASLLYLPVAQDQPQTVAVADPADSIATPKEIATANNDFAIEFYKLVSEKDGNIFFSPTSMHTAFSMLYEGARGNTAAELQQAFWFESDADVRAEKVAELMASLNRDDGYSTLRLANSVWLADWFEPYDSYADLIRGTYLADIESVDFTDPDDGVPKINAWASNKTNEKITKVISYGPNTNETAAVLANAIYFKGTWVTEFPKEDTAERDFWTSADESVAADFMYVKGIFNYASQDGVQVLKLPYKGDRLSMILILPAERDGIDRLESIISAEMLQELQNNTSPTEVKVRMPKFEMSTNYDLIPILENMDIKDAFSPDNANFSGMTDLAKTPENLYVDKATQDAFVNVNEEGTEAAAVTTIIVMPDSEPPPMPYFLADHPFIFIIQDDESKAILFMGRVSDLS